MCIIKVCICFNDIHVNFQMALFKNIFKCSLCKECFHSMEELLQHKESTDSHRDFLNCPICDVQCKGKDDLSQHFNQAHMQKENSCCPICQISFSNQTNLNQHLICVHCKIKPFKCRLCLKEFARKFNCTRHESSCSKDSKIVNESVEPSLWNEKKKNTGKSSGKTFECKRCKGKFKGSSNYDNHRKKCVDEGQSQLEPEATPSTSNFEEHNDAHELRSEMSVSQMDMDVMQIEPSTSGNKRSHQTEQISTNKRLCNTTGVRCRPCNIYLPDGKALYRHQMEVKYMKVLSLE